MTDAARGKDADAARIDATARADAARADAALNHIYASRSCPAQSCPAQSYVTQSCMAQSCAARSSSCAAQLCRLSRVWLNPVQVNSVWLSPVRLSPVQLNLVRLETLCGSILCGSNPVQLNPVHGCCSTLCVAMLALRQLFARSHSRVCPPPMVLHLVGWHQRPRVVLHQRGLSAPEVGCAARLSIFGGARRCAVPSGAFFLPTNAPTQLCCPPLRWMCPSVLAAGRGGVKRPHSFLASTDP